MHGMNRHNQLGVETHNLEIASWQTLCDPSRFLQAYNSVQFTCRPTLLHDHDQRQQAQGSFYFILPHHTSHPTSSYTILIPHTLSYLIPPHPTSSYLLILHPTSSYFILLHRTSSYPPPNSSNTILPHPTPSYLIPPPSNLILLHLTSSYFIARASTSKHEQILQFSDFGCFEPDITDFVKNL